MEDQNSWKDQSRKNWRSIETDESSIREQATVGALMRIADATEIMAGNFIQLQKDRDYWKEQYNRANAERLSLKATVKSLRGWNTRYKNRV